MCLGPKWQQKVYVDSHIYMLYHLDMNRGSDIRHYRSKFKLSQEALARLLQVSWITVNRWERGQPNPSYLTLKGIEAVLKETYGRRAFENG